MKKNKILRALMFFTIVIICGCDSLEENIDPDLRSFIAVCEALNSTSDTEFLSVALGLKLNDESGSFYKSETYANENGTVSEFKLDGNGVRYSFTVSEWKIGIGNDLNRKEYTGTLNDDAFLKDKTNKIDLVRDGSGWKLLVNGKNEDITPPTTGGGNGNGNGNGNGGGTGNGNSTVAINQCVEGNSGEGKIYKVTVPSNTSKMVIETSEDGGCYLNSADLFVRKGSNPVIHSNYPYKWTADESSILPNRDRENITISNPSGDYYILVYGFNNYFSSNLKVTLYN